MNASPNRQSQLFSLRRATRRVSLCMPTPTDAVELSPRIHVVVIAHAWATRTSFRHQPGTPLAAELSGLAKPRLIQFP